MKLIEKISLTLFSMIILVLSLILTLMLFNWLSISNVYYLFELMTYTPTITNILLAILVVLILLSIKCICFPSYIQENEAKKEGVLLENENGKLLISIDTIENITQTVLAEFSSIRNSNCKVKLDKQVNNIIIDLNIVVTANTIIKDLSVNIQDRIKETIKNTTEIEVKETNIRIKNIEAPKDNN